MSRVQLVISINRKEGTSPEEFYKYWTEVHGPMFIEQVPLVKKYISKYEQYHICSKESAQVVERMAARGSVVVDGAEGVSVLSADSLEDLEKVMNSKEFLEVVNPDNAVYAGKVSSVLLYEAERKIISSSATRQRSLLRDSEPSGWSERIPAAAADTLLVGGVDASMIQPDWPSHSRVDGSTLAHTQAFSSASDMALTNNFDRTNGPIHAEKHVRIICIGAGASGLCFAYKLQRSFSNFSLTIFEKNAEISGTWFENQYPGCACDVPAHNYTYSFEPKSDWSAVYASSKEIYQYFNDFAAKYNLGGYIQTSSQVVGATWDDAQGVWRVTVKHVSTGETKEYECDILINAGGILNAWKWPAISGLESFQNPLLHSAKWDSSVQLEGKHVGLIGNGSSGIQILPSIQPIVGKVTTFLRGPSWISPVTGLDQHRFSKEEQEAFASKPEHLLQYRKTNEDGVNALWPLYMRDSSVQSDARKSMLAQMKQKLGNESLEARLVPSFSVGCRRITPGVQYLETLSKENVQVVFGEIAEITERTLKSEDGTEYPVDVLICATGFDTTFKPRFDLIGLEGANLRNDWANEAKGYLGLAATAAFPNYLMFLGPNCPIGNGPVLSAIEAQADYMLQFVNRYQTENIKSFAPKSAAVADFNAHTDALMSKTVWTEDCRSWYKNNGRVSALWPGSTLHYIEAIREVRFDDWEVKYRGNRFDWMGNGYSQTEMDPTCDWSYYIRNHDDTPYASRAKQRQVLTKSGTKDAAPSIGLFAFD